VQVSVLVVDDSPTVRAVIRRLLETEPGFEVVAEAATGVEAVRHAVALCPDAVVMDLDLPELDGLRATEQIMARRPTPVVVVTSQVRREEMSVAFEAFKRGAVSVFAKPSVPDQWAELAATLPATLREVAGGGGPPEGNRDVRPAESRTALAYLLVGASTGGPGAVRSMLLEVPERDRLGIALVQHISSGFEVGLADWLGHELGGDVRLARDGEVLRPGRIRIAPAHAHLRLTADGVQQLDRESPPIDGHRPAVDMLFASAARLDPSTVAAVLLTGMGRDGAEGLLALRRRGAMTLAQDRSSSAVYGMPRVAAELGATDILLPPTELGRLIRRTMDAA
jgi:two-component system chemotaxis response regulator CheB